MRLAVVVAGWISCQEQIPEAIRFYGDTIHLFRSQKISQFAGFSTWSHPKNRRK